MANQSFKLRDPATTFYDPETKLKVAADQEVTIDAKQRKGKLTLQAIDAGGLIEVKGSAEKKESAAKGKDASTKGKGAE
jgi:hypothetical protein